MRNEAAEDSGEDWIELIGDLTIAALQQRVADIRWASESFLKTSMLSVPATGTLAVLGLGVPHALLAGAGISLTVSTVLYNLQKREEMRKNPYSCLLAAESRFQHQATATCKLKVRRFNETIQEWAFLFPRCGP